MKKNPIVQLEASKLSIKNLFSNLINEIKGFKYQITVKCLLKKYKANGEIEFAPVYFNFNQLSHNTLIFRVISH